MALISLIGRSALASVSYLPNPSLTSGGTLTQDLSVICHSGYSSTVRDVTSSAYNSVYAAYGITPSLGSYVIDHLIPLSSGGSNTAPPAPQANLWVEPIHQNLNGSDVGSYVKDYLEDTAIGLICNGTVPIATMQNAIATNWVQAYQTYVGSLPPYPYCPPTAYSFDPVCKGVNSLHPITTFQGQHIFTDKGKNIYFTAPNGIADAGTKLTVIVQGVNLTKTVSSDRCGVIHFKITTNSNNIRINDAPVDLGTATQISKGWGCSSTGTVTSKYYQAIVPSSTTPLLKTSTQDFYYLAGTPLAKYLIAYTGNITKHLTFGRCGWTSIRYSANLNYSASTQFSSTLGNVNGGSLVQAPGKPICVGGSSPMIIVSPSWIW